MSSIIKVEDIGKKYILNHRRDQRYTALRDVITNSVKSWGRKILQVGSADENKKSSKEEFWALDGVNFEINQGDRVGVIGRNGAGKSTLLKILSRITEPTTGRITLNGRVASLLEVGTGFHPELTGRENIQLNGAILGMSKNEIKRKFDEIVAFSEAEKFLDTPVKRFSSGMYVRLAFAVAAHLETEILIVDEVLAVGDAQFQKKCLGKMGEISKAGRTLLLVSHSMTSIQALANKAIFLKNGKTDGVESVVSAVDKYLYDSTKEGGAYYKAEIKGESDKNAQILEASILDAEFKLTSRHATCDELYIQIKWSNNAGVPVNPNFILTNQNGVAVMMAIDTPVDWDGHKKGKTGVYCSRAKIPAHLLNAGDYSLHLALDSAIPKMCYDVVRDALRFMIWDPMDEHCLGRGVYTGVFDDVVLLPALEWSWSRE